MFALDLFNTDHERRIAEGAVDQLEQRRIDDLAMKMDDLVARAKDPAYKKNPAALAALMKEFQKCKAERDSYYKVRNETMGYGGLTAEAGIPGNVPVEKIPGKEDLLKGRGRSYYEDQKKNSEQVDEYISMGSDKNYQEAEPYKNYRIYVRKKPFGTTGMYTAHTEIDRKEFMGKGSSQEEAVQAIQDRIDFVLNAQKKVTGSSTIDFNVKFATDLLADPRQTFYAKLENINGEPKLVIASAEVAGDPELLAAGDFKRSALRNQVDDSGRATPLPGIPLTAKGLRSGDWIANGRYTVGRETSDRDGNRVFDLTYHSTAHTKSDKLRLNQPAFTLGTAREVDEHGGGIGPRQHWQDLMPEQMNPEDYDDYEDEDEDLRLRSGDYVRDTMDGESGEVFRMQGDSYERRVRILDRDGKGWYIEPSRLTRVDPQDPDVQRYFGKKRVRDMDEAIVASGPSKPLDDRAVKKLVWDTMKINADSGEQAIQRALSVLAKKPQSRMVQDLQDKFQSLADRLSQGVAEGYERGSKVQHPKYGAGQVYKVYPNGMISVNFPEYLAPMSKNPGVTGNFNPGDSDYQSLKSAMAEGWSDAMVARRTGSPRTPYSVYIKGRKWKDFENEDLARAVMDRLKAKFKSDGRDPETVTIAPTDYDQPIKEEQDTSGVERAILNRIMVAHTDLLMKFGPDKVMQAAEEVAYNVGDVDEIGTSDVSAYVHQVKQILGVPEELDEKWSQKYKSSINCANPKGFSQKAHCAGRKK
jgi:hypothetical protein